MTKLNQILAIEKGTKSGLENAISSAYKAIQRQNIFFGISKRYEPKNADDDTYPPENTLVQTRANDLIAQFTGALGSLLNIEATKDYANCAAKGNIVIDDVPLLEGIPVTYLIWLEKQLINVRTFIGKLPILPPEKTWHFDENSNAYVTDERLSNRTKKVYKVLTKAPATDKHQADTEVYTEDEVVGNWTTRDFSGALPAKDIQDMIERVEKMRQAVIVARESANDMIVENQDISDNILNYIFRSQ